jgi:hypothetical protein
MKNNNKDIIYKMGLIGIVGLLGIIIATIVILQPSSKDKEINKNNVSKENNKNEEIKEFNSVLGVIKEVDIENDKLVILDIENEETITLMLDSSVEILDSYGTDIAFIQLGIGDIIQSKYDIEKMKPEYVHISNITWNRKDIKNMHIDEDKKTIQMGNDLYKFNDNLVTVYKNKPFKLSELTTADELVILGYRDTVWSIKKVTGHGLIRLKNHRNFVGGSLEVGNRKVIDIKDDTTVTMRSGVYNIVISKEGMSPYVTEIFLEEDEEIVIDVGNVKPKMGTVEFNIVQDNAVLYIDGKIVDYKDPVSLDFGKYDLKVKKSNFTTWERELVVNQAYIMLEINMEQEPVYIHVDNPIGCELYIDASYIGKIPVSSPISPGDHVITIRKQGYYSKIQKIHIDDKSEDNYFTFPNLIKMDDSTTVEGNKKDENNNVNNTTPKQDVYNQ